MKEITITPPNGYEIDKEKSTLEHIVFKKKRENKFSNYDGSYPISGYDIYGNVVSSNENTEDTKTIFNTLAEAKSAKAFAQLTQILKHENYSTLPFFYRTYDCFLHVDDCFSIIRVKNHVEAVRTCNSISYFTFRKSSDADRFMNENKSLLNQYFMVSD